MAGLLRVLGLPAGTPTAAAHRGTTAAKPKLNGDGSGSRSASGGRSKDAQRASRERSPFQGDAYRCTFINMHACGAFLIFPERARQFPAVEKSRFFAEIADLRPADTTGGIGSFQVCDLRPKAHQPPGGGRWTRRAHPFVSHFRDQTASLSPSPVVKTRHFASHGTDIFVEFHPASLRGL